MIALIPPGMSFWQACQAGIVRPMRSRPYLAYLHTLPCAVTGSRNITVHHVIGHGLKAMSSKTDDFLAFPLAAELHQDGPSAIHVIGSKAWEPLYGSQLEFSLRTLLQAIREGKLVWRGQ